MGEENPPVYPNMFGKNQKRFWSNIFKSILRVLVLCQGEMWVGRTLMLGFR